MNAENRAQTFVHDTSALLASGKPFRSLLPDLFARLTAFFEADAAALAMPQGDGVRIAQSTGSGDRGEAVEQAAVGALAGAGPAQERIAVATLRWGSSSVGAIALATREPLDSGKRLLFDTWSSIVSLRVHQLAIEEDNRRLETIAESDQLTGIANRRAFDARLRAEWQTSRRTAEPLSIVLVDIDFFKAYNDRYGHLAGDGALRRVADAIAGALRRPRDLAARYGGEEFVVLLPSTPEAESIELTERIRNAVFALRISHGGSGLGQMTISAGVATAAAREVSDAVELIARADASLYRAKEKGRNRVAARDYLSETQAATRADAGLHGLPFVSGPFIGRDEEAAALRDALARSRLVTIGGPGGAGKTRLAVEAARGAANLYSDGIWYVDVAACATAADVLAKFAASLGIAQHEGALREAVVERLRSQRLLAIVDGCERCVDGVRENADGLLRDVPNLQLLIVSRETLGLPGESILRLGGLSPEHARELFRARSERPAGAPGVDDDSIDAICKTIGYLPLGIELLVSQIATMNAAQLELLVTKRSTPLRTLDDVVAWSVGLLGDRRRRVFFALASFVGGFDAPAAHAVAAAEPSDLEALEAKSLLARGEGERFDMLDAVRGFALRTTSPGELEVNRERHLGYYSELARSAEPARLDSERENLDAALADLERGGRRAEMLALAGSLGPYWLRRGRLNEGLAWLLTALRMRGDAPPATITLANRYAGMISRKLGDFDAAREYNERALRGWREIGSVEGIGSALNGLALVAHTVGDFDRAQLLYEESMKLYERLDDATGVAMTINNLGGLAMFRGDFESANALMHQALDRASAAGNAPLVALATNNLGEVRFLQGRFDDAVELAQQSLQSRLQLDDRPGLAESWILLGNALLSADRIADAWQPVREGLMLEREIGNRRGMAMAILTTARLVDAKGRQADAAQLVAHADALFARTGTPLFGAERVVRDLLGYPRTNGSDAAGFDHAFEDALAALR